MPKPLPQQRAGRNDIASDFKSRPVLVTGGHGFLGGTSTRTLH